MKVYTLECQIENLPKSKDRFLKLDVKSWQKIVNEEKQILFSKLLNEEFDTSLLLERDKEVRRMLHFNKLASTEPFNKAYDKAIKYYTKGNWQKAAKYYDKCLVMKPADGPCKSVKQFIAENKYDAQAFGY